MRLELYFIAAGIIGVSLFRIHSYFNERYSGKDFYQQQVVNLQEDKDRLALEKMLIEKEKFDYKQSVAMKLPEALRKDIYQARNLASVISEEKGQIVFDDTEERVNEAKIHFNKGEFEKVESKLQIILKERADHPLAPEAVFLLMETKHFLGKREEASDIIETMLRLYPESHLTGYALLRLADYFIQEGDEDRAGYLYRFLQEKFSFDPQIVKSAELGERRLDD